MHRATVITTIDFRCRAWGLLARAYKFLKNAGKIGVDVIVGHADRGTFFDRAFLLMQKKFFPCVKVCSVKYHTDAVNNSMLRNIASKEIKTEFIIISDIDLYFDDDIITYMINESVKNGYAIIPCLYLSKVGTRYLDICKKREHIIDKWLNWEFSYFLHVAMPSSFMCVKSDIYQELGGFDERYEGHGYEDFDFMIRLIREYQMLDLSLTTDFDTTYVAPLFACGFRADLALFCLKALLNKKIVLHKFHKKDKFSYNREREHNKKIFYDKFFYNHDSGYSSATHTIPKLLHEFYLMCERYDFDPKNFSILFNDCPRWKLLRNTHGWR